MDWPLAERLGDEELERLLYPADGAAKPGSLPLPDWHQVHRDLRRKGVTLSLLWEEYQSGCEGCGYSYSRFCELYRSWEGRLEPVMRQRHPAGERLYVDYAGHTVPVVCPDTGTVRQVEVFVSCMGASSLIYAEAAESQSLEDWTGSHVRAFEY